MNIAASGVGKSQSRKRLIAEPLEYMMRDKELKIPDFEVCNFTRAGKFSIVIHINNFIPIIIFYMFLLQNSTMVHTVKYSTCVYTVS